MNDRNSNPVTTAKGGKGIQDFTLSKPILMCFILFSIALVFRWVDTFVFRLDELLGELILTKSLGFGMVLLFVWAAGRRVKDIGLHSRMLGLSLLVGVLSTAVGFVFGYGLDFLIAVQQGVEPALQLGAIDPKMGVTGGFLFALWLLFGNFVNSFMEEGLFRGVMARLGRLKFNFWGTNLFTAFMFAIWHLPWVLKYYQLGEIETGGEIAMSIVYNSVPQFLIGLVYGYLYLKTNSLWAPWIAHTISNSIGNFLHIITNEGLDTNLPLRMMVYLVVMFFSLIWVKRVAERNQIEEVKPWE
jgi:membrane protease YdiL (CAAX protease family)